MTFNLNKNYFSEKFAIWDIWPRNRHKIAQIEVFGHFLDFASLVFLDFARNDRWAWCLVVFLQFACPVVYSCYLLFRKVTLGPEMYSQVPNNYPPPPPPPPLPYSFRGGEWMLITSLWEWVNLKNLGWMYGAGTDHFHILRLLSAKLCYTFEEKKFFHQHNFMKKSF